MAAIYEQRDSLKLDAESLRLVEYYYKKFVHSGANLSDSDKTELKKLNEEESTLTNAFTTKLLAATKDARFVTKDKDALAGLSDAQITAAALAAKDRKLDGYVVPLQNTTQQPDLDSLSHRSTRQTLFENSWNRAEHGGANDTREIVARLAQLRAQKAKLLGFPNYAAWKLEDQMAKTPDAALKFMDALVPGATARADRRSAATSRRSSIDAQEKAGFKLEPWDWNFYAEQVRKAKYDLDEVADQAVFRAEQRAGERRVLRRHPALRHHLQGAQGHSGVQPGRARVRGVRRRRPAAGPVLRATTSSATTRTAAPG